MGPHVGVCRNQLLREEWLLRGGGGGAGMGRHGRAYGGYGWGGDSGTDGFASEAITRVDRVPRFRCVIVFRTFSLPLGGRFHATRRGVQGQGHGG